MPAHPRVDTRLMGRVFFFVILAGTAWLLLDILEISIDPRGVGTRIDGREIVVDADQLEARFSMVGSLDETYMLFGGDAQQRRNSLTHVTAAGLPMIDARAIAASYPDFHMCKSPGAKPAKRATRSMSFVAADRATLDTLTEAVELFHERVRAGGERTCIRISGAPIELDSVHVVDEDMDITGDVAPLLARSEIVLARSAEIRDCQPLLR